MKQKITHPPRLLALGPTRILGGFSFYFYLIKMYRQGKQIPVRILIGIIIARKPAVDWLRNNEKIEQEEMRKLIQPYEESLKSKGG